jgi:hypothetical protein
VTDGTICHAVSAVSGRVSGRRAGSDERCFSIVKLGRGAGTRTDADFVPIVVLHSRTFIIELCRIELCRIELWSSRRLNGYIL